MRQRAVRYIETDNLILNDKKVSPTKRATLLAKQDLPLLLDILLRHYKVIAPIYNQELQTIELGPISSPDQLAVGYQDYQRPGHYSVTKSDDGTLFGYANGPHSPKSYLHPGRITIFTAQWREDGFSLTLPSAPERPLAFFGIRPCDLVAIQVLDRTFLHVANVDARYRSMREGSFIATINCTKPSDVCFCASMGSGPRAEGGYDLRITELADGLLMEPGTERGSSILAAIPSRVATRAEQAEAERAVLAAIPRMGRVLDIDYLPQLLLSSFEHPYWDYMGEWCVGCTNCTIVCPTCFCNDIRDYVDLRLKTTRRDRVWDSCFTLQFAQICDVKLRDELKYRYRHWFNHKLGYWVEQYGVFGCVGCGRCITWCPVGIDITGVAATIRGAR